MIIIKMIAAANAELLRNSKLDWQQGDAGESGLESFFAFRVKSGDIFLVSLSEAAVRKT